jgi:hypothetical protein
MSIVSVVNSMQAVETFGFLLLFGLGCLVGLLLGRRR